MADVAKTRSDPIAQFWDMTDEVSAGMLGVEGSGDHMQPMHPNCDPEGDAIWFFAKVDSELAQSIGESGHGHFCVIGRDHDYHACVGGELTVSRDRAAIERFWSPVVAAWFKSKDDPDVAMVKLALHDGVAWASVGGAKFGWEIAKANATDGEPDVGAREHFSFASRGDAEDPKETMTATNGIGGNPAVPRGEGQV